MSPCTFPFLFFFADGDENPFGSLLLKVPEVCNVYNKNYSDTAASHTGVIFVTYKPTK